MINAYKIFGGNHQGVVHVVDLSADGGYKVRMNHREVECESLEWNQLA